MIVLINPNSTVSMTDAMVRTARDVARGIKVVGWTSHDGPSAIQGPEDGEASVPPLLELVAKAAELGPQAVIIGCFDDTGLDEARAIAGCPVIGIGQAAYHMAVLAGERFSVVTTLAVSVPVLEGNIRRYGLAGHLGRVRASGVAVLDLERDPEASALRVLDEVAEAAREDGVQSIVLGCAGMVDLPARAAEVSNLRIIDGVRSAVQIGALF
ncbi:aspartate/glutamate racemase family protein [Puniceibacterium confluentis]|uniref:aspartate/glutamate racemase family protein n=1 Tax=Puniceibacterium confluentis TaxID=1958944 RepID=UPI0011B7693A|nr:aspartate/glutamate racemase family protein [Puniceibacterium confluentis]